VGIRTLLGVGAVAAMLSISPATAAAANPCPAQTHYAWMGESASESVTIPSLTHPSGITDYQATILRPADGGPFPGARPVVLLQHGLGGNQCAQWWTAQDLAGHGYVAILWTAPQGANTTEAFFNAVDAMRSAIAFVRTPANPYSAASDTARIALAGHSLGSIVASYVQQDADPGVRAVVALDNLRRWVNGDPGGAVFECTANQALEITPRVPAIGFAKDAPCDAKPDYAPADLKQAGFLWWREHGQPSMELVMAGFDHLAFATPGSEQQHRELAYFIEAWLDRWLLDDPAAEGRLLADTALGVPTASLLSTRFLSGAYLPQRIDTADYLGFLNDVTAPNTYKLHGPTGRISQRRARRGLKFKFASGEPGATEFECRLDQRSYRACKSPRRVNNDRLGRHAFRVRATDARGNVEPKPAVWRYLITG
jgi:pimeloyl-ACP methyl ester carboxylesterase